MGGNYHNNTGSHRISDDLQKIMSTFIKNTTNNLPLIHSNGLTVHGKLEYSIKDAINVNLHQDYLSLF
jgi:hypothetical protein